MRVLMAASVPGRREGGAAAIALGLGTALTGLGHRVDYLFIEDLVDSPMRRRRFVELEAAFNLAKFILRHRTAYDIVHLHAPVGLVYGLARRLAPGSGLPPYIGLLHGLEERRIYSMRREARKGRVAQFGPKNRIWHGLYHAPRYRAAVWLADMVTCYCRDVWTMLQLSYGIDPQRVAYIPNGVDQRFFFERQYSERNPVQLLFAGTWLEQRGLYYLREAFRDALRLRPDLRLTFAGCAVTPDVVHAYFGSDVSSSIDVVPFVASDDMPSFYARHDVFVFPSLMEGLPSVLLEAMASGMPVITTETCGMVDCIDSGFDGLLVPPADSAALTRAILQLAAGPDERLRLGRAAQARMRRFTWSRAGLRLQEAFNTILLASRGTTANRA